jgi:hypothetical protein
MTVIKLMAFALVVLALMLTPVAMADTPQSLQPATHQAQLAPPSVPSSVVSGDIPPPDYPVDTDDDPCCICGGCFAPTHLVVPGEPVKIASEPVIVILDDFLISILALTWGV